MDCEVGGTEKEDGGRYRPAERNNECDVNGEEPDELADGEPVGLYVGVNVLALLGSTGVSAKELDDQPDADGHHDAGDNER